MKFVFCLLRHSLFLVVIVVSPAVLRIVNGQDQPGVKAPNSPSTTASQVSEPTLTRDVSRQNREQAYVKLFAGQRLLVQLRNGDLESAAVVEIAKQAQSAFEEAGQLDPTLAEAYTALAEIALFYYPRNMDEAVRRASKAILIDRNNVGGHQTLGRVYAIKSGLKGQQLDKTFAERAIVELREVSRLTPNDSETWALLGELYLALGRTDDAIQALTRWAAAPAGVSNGFYQFITDKRDLTPDAAAARLGEALMLAGRRREAIVAIRRALFLSPQNEAYEDLLSRVVDSEGDDDEAVITELRSTIAAEPQGTAAPILLARALTRAGRVNEAVQVLQTAISRRAVTDKENTLSLRLALAQTFADSDRFDDGVAVYQAILLEKGITGNIPLVDQSKKQIASELLRRIIELYKNAGKSKEALATIERMRLILGSDDPTITFEEVDLLRALGKRREALKVLQTARRLFPQQSEFVFQEAVVLTELGKVDQGVSLLRSRLSQQSKPAAAVSSVLPDIDLYLRISNLYIQADRGADAVAAARQAVELAPADQPDIISAALIALSSAQEHAGDAKGSEESLRRVLASEPDNATALNNLGYFLVERNERLSEALEMIQRAVKAEPTNSSFLDSLGWAHFKLGQFDAAERQLTEAARRGSGSATIQEHLGDVYFGQGKKEQARVAWEKSLKLLTDGDQASRIRQKLKGTSK